MRGADFFKRLKRLGAAFFARLVVPLRCAQDDRRLEAKAVKGRRQRGEAPCGCERGGLREYMTAAKRDGIPNR